MDKFFFYYFVTFQSFKMLEIYLRTAQDVVIVTHNEHVLHVYKLKGEMWEERNEEEEICND